MPARGRLPTLKAFILEKCSQGAEAYGLITQLKAALLPEESRKLELPTVAQQLEEALAAREALLQESANQPGASASTIVSALLKERSMLVNAAGRPSDNSISSNPDGEMPLPSAFASEAAILKSAEFRAVCVALASTDTSTLDGAREALLHGFNGKCVLTVRTLCSTTRMGDPVARRHPTLGILNGLRSARIDYFNFSLRVNLLTKQVPFRMTKYHFATVQRGSH